MTTILNTLKAINHTLETLGAIAGQSMRQQTSSTYKLNTTATG